MDLATKSWILPLIMSQIPSFPRNLSRPPVGQNLRELYFAWLSTSAPYDKKGRNVAGSKTRSGISQGQALAEASRDSWEKAAQAFSTGKGKVWVWSDLHLFHANVIRYCGRPFYNTDQMFQTLLENAQSCVGSEDWLLCLGDLSFGFPDRTREFIEAIPGHKALILGNHDVDRPHKLAGIEAMGFDAIADVQDWAAPAGLVDLDGTGVDRVWLTHYPLWSPWLAPGVRNVHGHVHQHNIGGRCINASIEHTGYAPVLLEDLVRSHRVEGFSPAVDDIPKE